MALDELNKGDRVQNDQEALIYTDQQENKVWQQFKNAPLKEIFYWDIMMQVYPVSVILLSH